MHIGLVLLLVEDPPSGRPSRWDELQAMSLVAEEIGFDTVWIPDELLWRPADWPGPRGWWECVAIAGAVAASTRRVKVGTWILSALHRNPALTAKVATTLDEITGGRFVLGLGTGHAGTQAEAFGFPMDHVYGRFEEAFRIMLPLLREGRADFDGTYHRAKDLELRPLGPQGTRIPILLGARGPKMLRIAAEHADIWSWYAGDTSDPEQFVPMLADLDRACEEIGRDPASIGRSVGIVVEPTDRSGAAEHGMGVPIRGSAEEIAAALASFATIGITRIETMLWPGDLASVEAMGPVLDALGPEAAAPSAT
ncbi:MAG: hypothetical protein A2Z32_01270 [Chloroflexi bacterium RBG_16_69_14]|nr:MAG: hypothetical protein A2Z32_01270 [Chloroflexi bacterium RBG_16_69_14]